jgi:hypothetical protein
MLSKQKAKYQVEPYYMKDSNHSMPQVAEIHKYFSFAYSPRKETRSSKFHQSEKSDQIGYYVSRS